MNCGYILWGKTSNPPEIASWFSENFGFSQEKAESFVLLKSGDLHWSWEKGEGTTNVWGLHHVALASSDIDAALAYCEKRNLSVDTDNGKPHRNPGVWGNGTRYFNILTPFGFVLEICQRMDLQYDPDAPIIGGLEHIGIYTSDISRAEIFYRSLGFQIAYPRVTNEKENGQVLCTMLSNGSLMLELFSVRGGDASLPPATYSGLERIEVLAESEGIYRGPDGESIALMCCPI